MKEKNLPKPTGVPLAIPAPERPDAVLHQLQLDTARNIIRQMNRPDPFLAKTDPLTQTQLLIDILCELSMHDGLTGLVNQSGFHAALARELQRTERTGHGCAVLLLDLDHFKRLNDTYGHAAGDATLRLFGQVLTQTLRPMDVAARVGGEEFAVLLAACAPDDAVHTVHRIHQAISPLTVPWDSHTITVTVSAGLAWTLPEAACSASQLYMQADRELYRAKQTGRARVCHAERPAPDRARAERQALLDLLPQSTNHSDTKHEDRHA